VNVFCHYSCHLIFHRSLFSHCWKFTVLGVGLRTDLTVNWKLYIHPFNGRLSGTTQVSMYQKGKTIWILLKLEAVSGSGISCAVCKSAPRSRQITTPAPHHLVFYWPDALPAAQPTVLKHWRQKLEIILMNIKDNGLEIIAVSQLYGTSCVYYSRAQLSLFLTSVWNCFYFSLFNVCARLDTFFHSHARLDMFLWCRDHSNEWQGWSCNRSSPWRLSTTSSRLQTTFCWLPCMLWRVCSLPFASLILLTLFIHHIFFTFLLMA